MAVNSSFTPYGNGYRLDLSTSTASVQIALAAGQTPQTILVTNTGTVAVSVVWAYGASAPTAVAATVGTPQAGVVLAAGTSRVFSIGATPSPSQSLWLAGVSVSGTATIYFSVGDGR